MRSFCKYFFPALIIVLIFSCTKDGSLSTADGLSSGTGKDGSLAKFTIGHYLYAVDMHYLYTYNIANPVKNPVKTNTSEINFDMETIYPLQKQLYLSVQKQVYTFIRSLLRLSLLKVGEAKHGRSCDPVVATDSVAYVTLKGETFVARQKMAYMFMILKIFFSLYLKTPLKLVPPGGLGLQDSTLYVCCNANGLRIYNVKDPYNPVEKKVFERCGLQRCYSLR